MNEDAAATGAIALGITFIAVHLWLSLRPVHLWLSFRQIVWLLPA